MSILNPISVIYLKYPRLYLRVELHGDIVPFVLVFFVLFILNESHYVSLSVMYTLSCFGL